MGKHPILIILLVALVFLPGSEAMAKLLPGTSNSLPRLVSSHGGTFTLGKRPYPPGTRAQWIAEGRALACAPTGAFPRSRSLKGAVDNRSILPPIGNQGSEGSCVHWAGAYYTKTANMKRMNPSLNVTATSNQCSPRFTYNLTNVGEDNGGYGHEPFEIFMRYGGASLKQKPYVAGQYTALPGVEDFVEGLHRRTTNYVWVWDWDPGVAEINELKAWLDAGGVAACGVYAEDTFDAWGKGDAPWVGATCTVDDINHMVTVCGYGPGYYLVVNSWGTSFGSNGYIVVDSDYFENYFSDVMYPLEGTYEPATAYAKVQIQHGRRSDIRSLAFSVNGGTVWSNSPLPKNMPQGTGSFDKDIRDNWNLAVDLSAGAWGSANTVTARCMDTVTASAGSMTNFIVYYNGTNYVSTDTPVPIPDNTGVPAFATVSMEAPTATRIIGVTGNLLFGNVQMGSTSNRTMILTNSGNSTLTVSDIDCPAGFGGAWSGALAAGGSYAVTVTFSPTAVQDYGGTVTVNSDKTSGNNTLEAAGAGTAAPAPVLSVTPGNREVTSAAGTTTFAVTNTGDGTMAYAATESESWLTITGGGGGTNGGTVTVTYDANSGTTVRTGTVVVTATGASESPRSVTVVQAAQAASLEINPTTTNLSSVAANGLAISVAANVPWTAVSNAAWIAVTGGSSGSGNGTVMYGVAANGGISARTGMITVAGGGITRTFTVIQAGSSPAVSRKINCGGATTGSWEADGSWTMSTDGGADSFANMIANAGDVPQVVYQTRRYGKTVTYSLTIPDGTYNVRLHFAELYWTAAGKKRFNVTIEGRTVWTNLDLFVAAGGKNRALTRTFENVVVSGGLQIQGVASVGAAQFNGIEVWSAGPPPASALSVTPASQPVGFASGTTTFAVTNTGGGTMVYTTSESETWLGITGGGSGTNGGTVTVSYDANSGASARTGTVVVAASGASGSPRSVTIVQAAQTASLAINPTATNLSSAAASGKTIGVTANISWTAASNAAWIAVTGGSSGSGNGTVTYSVAANGGTAARTGTITVAGGGITRICTVIQAGSSPAVSRKINCGGTATGSWEADGSWTMSTDGGADTFANVIANAGEVPQAVYQSRRYGKTVTYNLAIPDGTYNVRLHFAELYWTAAGKKRFNVTIEGRMVLTNLDLFVAAGGKNIAMTRTFENVVVSGGLQIQGVASVGAAQFHGIEVWSAGASTKRALSAKSSATWPVVEARSGDSPWVGAPELVDGDTHTLWIGNADASSWSITLDFGESIPLQNLDILYEDQPRTNVGVMGTSDMLKWFDLGLLTNGPISCRALYLHFPDDESGEAPAIREIQWKGEDSSLGL